MDLKKNYTLFLEIGIMISLLVFLGIMKLPIKSGGEKNLRLTEQQEAVNMEQIEQTKQKERPPAPPRPQVPVAVPNDEVIIDEIPSINAELNINEAIELPLPPPPDQEGEENNEEEEDFFVVVEQMPILIGGIQSLQQKIKYPEMARKAGIEGRIIIQFIVNERGEVENPHIIRGIGGGCDEEALQVVQQAKFKPGLQRGRPVRVQYSLPIVFKLTG